MSQRKQTLSSSPRQEMNFLRNKWSVVQEGGDWMVLPTKTIVVGRGEEELEIGGYIRGTGIEVFSIFGDEGINRRFEHHSYARELGFLGVHKVVHRSWVATESGASSDQCPPCYPALRDVFLPVQPGQVLKIISRPVMPMRPYAETAKLLNVALTRPDEYQDVFMVQKVCETIEPYIGRFATRLSTASLYTEGLQSAFAVPDIAS